VSGTLAAPAGAVLRAKETDQLWTFLRDPEIYKGGIERDQRHVAA